mmetsp:Transcript_18646/g.39648  ORF Transcript_18646/g.39648 Transcript_18646/m.39648 type:complete len:324 (-) Transcript_18646:261-1232(-)
MNSDSISIFAHVRLNSAPIGRARARYLSDLLLVTELQLPWRRRACRHLGAPLVAGHVFQDLVRCQFEGSPAPITSCLHVLFVLQDLGDLRLPQHHHGGQQPLFAATATKLHPLLKLKLATQLPHEVLTDSLWAAFSVGNLQAVEGPDVGLQNVDRSLVPARQQRRQPTLRASYATGLLVPLDAQAHGCRSLLADGEILHDVLSDLTALHLNGASVGALPIRMHAGDAQGRFLPNPDKVADRCGFCCRFAHHAAALQHRVALSDDRSAWPCALDSELQGLARISAARQEGCTHQRTAQCHRRCRRCSMPLASLAHEVRRCESPH